MIQRDDTMTMHRHATPRRGERRGLTSEIGMILGRSLFPICAILLIAGTALSAPQVFAQDSEDAAELDRIEVTGSRIKRVDIETTTPVTVIDREMIEMQGDLQTTMSLCQQHKNCHCPDNEFPLSLLCLSS